MFVGGSKAPQFAPVRREAHHALVQIAPQRVRRFSPREAGLGDSIHASLYEEKACCLPGEVRSASGMPVVIGKAEGGSVVSRPRPEREGTRHRERLCIVMACGDAAEAAQVGQQLLQLNIGCLITYRKADDILLNLPSGKVVLVVLATAGDPDAIQRTLRWMTRRWPRCPITVIGDIGGGEMEIAARKGGASYLTRPVAPAQWAALLRHVLHVPGRVASEDRLRS